MTQGGDDARAHFPIPASPLQELCSASWGYPPATEGATYTVYISSAPGSRAPAPPLPTPTSSPSKAGLQSGGQGRLRLVTSSLTRVQKPAGPITGFLPILLRPWRETDERTCVLSSPKMAIHSIVLVLRYSCLENPRDGGAWWAAVHRVAKRQVGAEASQAPVTSPTFPQHAPSRARTLEAGKRWARLAQARAASRPGI